MAEELSPTPLPRRIAFETSFTTRVNLPSNDFNFFHRHAVVGTVRI